MRPPGVAVARAPDGDSASPQSGSPPSLHQDLVDRLCKLAVMRQGGVIEEAEFRSRKVDLLSAVAGSLDRDQIDDLLFDLMPLFNEGILSREDIDFVKQLGGQ